TIVALPFPTAKLSQREILKANSGVIALERPWIEQSVGVRPSPGVLAKVTAIIVRSVVEVIEPHFGERLLHLRGIIGLAGSRANASAHMSVGFGAAVDSLPVVGRRHVEHLPVASVRISEHQRLRDVR